MARAAESNVAQRVAAGLLTFPVTHFHADQSFDEHSYRRHCATLLGHDVAALFAAGGTGEFFSLTATEIIAVVKAAVEETAGRVPVIAGCGYGTAIAIDLARAAEAAGADGILLLPPYLVGMTQAGLAAHVEAVCRAVSIGVIQYNRANAVLDADALAQVAERCPNLIGIKDGVGDLELLARIRSKLGDRLVHIGGLPTAETFATPYLAMGVTTYSSAIFNFAPEWALAFYRAVRRGDTHAVDAAMTSFVMPYLALRDRSEGYAVSIVKAGLRVTGQPAGPVRLPLTDLTAAEDTILAALIEAVVPQAVSAA